LLAETGAAQGDFWVQMTIAGIQVNLILMALNLVPLPPLDGGRIVFSLLPSRMAWQYSRIEPYGLLIVIVLMVTGILWTVLQPFLAFGQSIGGWFLSRSLPSPVNLQVDPGSVGHAPFCITLLQAYTHALSSRRYFLSWQQARIPQPQCWAAAWWQSSHPCILMARLTSTPTEN